MAALDFPNSPTNGQQYSAPNGAIYTWDGAGWTSAGVIGTGSTAGGDLTWTYPNPTIAAGAVNRSETAADLWLSPIPTGADVGKYLSVSSGPVLAWAAISGGAPS